MVSRVAPEWCEIRAPEWEKLVIVAHTAYTGGMHVSGIIHRSLVWLEWD
jgi:hypothetical protein